MDGCRVHVYEYSPGSSNLKAKDWPGPTKPESNPDSTTPRDPKFTVWGVPSTLVQTSVSPTGPERAKALAEMVRVLKPGGMAIVPYLNCWGLVRTGVTDFPDRYRDLSFLRAMLEEVAFRQPLPGFTVCHWSTPLAARQELQEAGFEVVSYASAEGAVGGTGPLIDKLAESDPVAYANVTAFVAETWELPQFRDGGDHLVFVVRRAQ